MELIHQEPGTSTCAPCVLAMLAGISREHALDVMGDKRTYPARLKVALSLYGLRMSNRGRPLVDGRGPEGVSGAAFAFSVPVGERRVQHWLAWDGTRFYDPLNGIMERIPDDWKCGVYTVERIPVLAGD